MRFLSWYTAMTVCLSLGATRQAAGAGEDGRLDKLLDAIAVVESRNDPTAVGDGGRASGVYQIHRSYWADATRILGVTWDYGEAKDPQKARQVVRAYLCHYGRGKTLLDLARIHNGGPRGDQKAATLAYARKIRQVFASEATGPSRLAPKHAKEGPAAVPWPPAAARRAGA